MLTPIQQWCIEKHQATNHFYDKYLPYEFHLRMVVQVYYDFARLLEKNMFTEKFVVECDITEHVIISSCWGHDLIEDTRTNYHEVLNKAGKDIADIIYALTNEKGRNREERGNEKYYEGIRNTKGATFVKLCDRIANVQYSKMTHSSMYDKYKKENDKFLEMMGFNPSNSHQLWDMFIYLENLFRDGH